MNSKEERLHFKIHTFNLLSEVLSNNSTQILRIPILTLCNCLRRLAQIAAQLNDPALNKLMCEMTLYTIADMGHEDYDKEAVKEVMATPDAPQGPIYERLGFSSGWDEHPDHPKSDWHAEVESNATYLGYWEWLEALLKD